jgi:hypothetical protein
MPIFVTGAKYSEIGLIAEKSYSRLVSSIAGSIKMARAIKYRYQEA